MRYFAYGLFVFLGVVFGVGEAEAVEICYGPRNGIYENFQSAVPLIKLVIYIFGAFFVGVGGVKIWRFFRGGDLEEVDGLVENVPREGAGCLRIVGAVKYLFMGAILWMMPTIIEETMGVVYPHLYDGGIGYDDGWNY